MAAFDFSSHLLPLPPPSAHIPQISSRHRTSAQLMVFSSTQTVDHSSFLNHVDSKTVPVWQSRDVNIATQLTTIDMNAPRQSANSLTGGIIMQPPKAMLAPATGNDRSLAIKREQVKHSTALDNENRVSSSEDYHNNTIAKTNTKPSTTPVSSLPLGILPTDHESGLAENAQPKSNQAIALTATADGTTSGDEDTAEFNFLGDSPVDIKFVEEEAPTPKALDIVSTLTTIENYSCENILTSTTLVDAFIEQNARLDATGEVVTCINASVECTDDKQTNEFIPPSTALSHSSIEYEAAAELVVSESWEMKFMDEYMNDGDLSESDERTAEKPSAAPPVTFAGTDELPAAADVASSAPLSTTVTDLQTTPAPLKPRTTETHNTRHVNRWQPPYRMVGPRSDPDLSYIAPPRRRRDHRRIVQEMMEAMEKAGLEEQRRAEEVERRAAAIAVARRPTFKKWVRSVLESIKRLLKPTKRETPKSEVVSKVEEESKSSLKEPEPAKVAMKPVTLVAPIIQFTVCKYRPKSPLKCNEHLLHPTWLTHPERRHLTVLMHDGVSRCQATRDVLLARNLGAHASKSLNDLKYISGSGIDTDAALAKLVGDTHEASPTNTIPSPPESSKSASPEPDSSSSTIDHHVPPFKRDGRLLHPTWLTRAQRCSVVEITEHGLTRRDAMRELLKARGQRATKAESLDGLKDIGDVDTDKDACDMSSNCPEPDSGAFSSTEAPQSDAVAIEPSPSTDAVAIVMAHSEPTEELKMTWTGISNKVRALFSISSAGWHRAGGA